MAEGRVVWITGLSGSGKTTVANPVAARLRECSHPVILLDGDELRAVFGASATTPESHDRTSRIELAMRYARLCRMLAEQGHWVVISTISLFREVHEWNRANQPGYLEIFLDVPVEELRRRDPKDIYRRFDAGEISNVAGLDLAVDRPERPDLHVAWRQDLDVSELVARILEKLRPEAS